MVYLQHNPIAAYKRAEKPCLSVRAILLKVIHTTQEKIMNAWPKGNNHWPHYRKFDPSQTNQDVPFSMSTGPISVFTNPM